MIKRFIQWMNSNPPQLQGWANAALVMLGFAGLVAVSIIVGRAIGGFDGNAGFDWGGFVGAILGVVGVFAVNHLQVRSALAKDEKAQAGAALLTASTLRLRFVTFLASVKTAVGVLADIDAKFDSDQLELHRTRTDVLKLHLDSSLERLARTELATLDLALRMSPENGAALMERAPLADHFIRTALAGAKISARAQVRGAIDHLSYYLGNTTLILKPLAEQLGPSKIPDGAQTMADALVEAKNFADVLGAGDLNNPLIAKQRGQL